MPKTKLTAAAVERLNPPASGRLEYFDLHLPGFGLRITEKGSKSWVVFYRVGGRQRRMTLGSYPAIGLAEAREAARKAMRAAAEGNDPALERAAKRVAPTDMIEDAVQLFLDRHVSGLRSAREVGRIFEVHVLPAWRGRLLKNVARRDVVELVEAVADRRGPYMGNRTLAAVRKFFNWCVQRDMVGASPVTNVAAPGKEVKRDRVLSDEEIQQVWGAFDVLGWPFGPVFKLMLVTAQRRGELAAMRWQDVDLDAATWTIPAAITKAKRVHEVHLSPMAVRILRDLPRLGDHVITSGRAGDKPIRGWSKAKARADRESGVDDWRLHDLRRTAASGMARLGTPPHVLARVLNHAPGSTEGVTAIYNRYGYESDKRAALEAWARKLEGVVGQNDGEVVPGERTRP